MPIVLDDKVPDAAGTTSRYLSTLSFLAHMRIQIYTSLSLHIFKPPRTVTVTVTVLLYGLLNYSTNLLGYRITG